MYVRFLCPKSCQFTKWNLNEIVGEVVQCLASTSEKRNRFAKDVMGTFLAKCPEHEDLVHALVNKDHQWNEIKEISETKM